jgi:beta-lactamase class A
VAEAIKQAVTHHEGKIGVAFRSLATGQTAGVNGSMRFTAASLYKLFVLEAAEAEIEDGSLDPGETLTMTPEAAAADPYFDYLIGTRVSVNCALQTMVQMSGNGASDVLRRRVGLSSVMARFGIDGARNTGLTDDWFTSPDDVASVLESMYRGQSVNQAASQRMLDLLAGQQQNDRVPAPLPLDVRIAHKTGELPDLRHDAAIVFAPSGAYVLAVLVEDAPSESAARSAAVEISRAVYDAVEPAGLATYAGLPPRLAQEVFRLPDAQGRLLLLGDPRTETSSLPQAIERAADAPADVRLRPEVFDDLVALQRAAKQNNAAFWVQSAFEQPTDADATHAVPTEWLYPCAVEQPKRTADRPVAEKPSGPHQAWLGTSVTVTDRAEGSPSVQDDSASPVWQWLQRNSAGYGFIPALPEGTDTTHMPWTLRWVGRDMARRLQPFDAARARTELQTAERELATHDLAATRPPPWDLSGACWTIATDSGAGCPSRWYFLELPLT